MKCLSRTREGESIAKITQKVQAMPAMQQHKPFLKLFEVLLYRWNGWEAWSDWIECLAITIANRVDTVQAPVREETYKRIIARYNSEEQSIFAQLASAFFEAMEANPHQDFLGSLFMCLALSNHWKGQFFSPYSLCAAMARLHLNDDKVKQIVSQKGYITVCDPACGAGATLIAARNELSLLGVGGDSAWFVAQDIDRTAGLMCYLQLAVLGCAGYVCIADTLHNPTVTDGTFLPVRKEGQDIWYLPYTYMGAWPGRAMWARMNQALDCATNSATDSDTRKKKRERKPAKKQEIITVPADQELPGQLSLF